MDQWRENALKWCNENKFTNKDGLVSAKSWESSHYQPFMRVYLSTYSHFDSILNEYQLKCNSYKPFKQLSVLWYSLISSKFSKEDSSGEEIEIYVKLFLFVCNSFGKAVKNRREENRIATTKIWNRFLFINNKLFQSTKHAWNGKIALKYQRNIWGHEWKLYSSC